MIQQINKSVRNSKTIWGITLAVALLVGGILAWQYWFQEEVKAPRREVNENEIINEAIGSIRKYLHKDAVLYGVTMPPEAEYHAISLENAIVFAIQYLGKRGVKEITICETGWIAAPLGGFLINGKGNFNIGVKHYSTFRIGIRDGSEGNVGEEFAFIARGEDEKGNVVWYPEPGPDFRPAEGEVFPEELMVYDFLGDRQKFETLSDRFK